MQHGLLLSRRRGQLSSKLFAGAKFFWLEDDSGWEKHPAKKGKTLDCDWVTRSPKKRCKKKNKGGTKASKACACACA